MNLVDVAKRKGESPGRETDEHKRVDRVWAAR